MRHIIYEKDSDLLLIGNRKFHLFDLGYFRPIYDGTVENNTKALFDDEEDSILIDVFTGSLGDGFKLIDLFKKLGFKNRIEPEECCEGIENDGEVTINPMTINEDELDLTILAFSFEISKSEVSDFMGMLKVLSEDYNYKTIYDYDDNKLVVT